MPGATGLVVGALLLLVVRDSPEAVGYPPVETVQAKPKEKDGSEAPKESLVSLLLNNVLKNPFIWGMAFTYFFVYVVRQGVTSWFVFYLIKARRRLAELLRTVASGLEDPSPKTLIILYASLMYIFDQRGLGAACSLPRLCQQRMAASVCQALCISDVPSRPPVRKHCLRRLLPPADTGRRALILVLHEAAGLSRQP